MINSKIFSKLSLIKIANYLLILALAAKVFFFYDMNHPSKDELFHVEGVVREAHTGVHGASIYFLVESSGEVLRYSSYYAKVWPGMERIVNGDMVSIFAERNKLKKGQFITGQEYWIWEMTKGNDVIVTYENVQEMLHEQEAVQRVYVNYFLYFAIAFFLFAYIQNWISNASESPSSTKRR